MNNNITCPNCGSYISASNVPLAVNDNNFVKLLTDEQLRSPAHVNQMAKECAALDIPSRQLPTEIANTIFGYRGSILNHVGMRYEVGVNSVDNAFRVKAKQVDGNQEDDLDWTPDFRWVRLFYKRAFDPGTQTAQIRITARLRLIHIFLEIKKQQAGKAMPSGGAQ